MVSVKRTVGIGLGAIAALGLAQMSVAQVGAIAQEQLNSPEQPPALETVRSSLSDLQQFPLFLPPEKGTLSSADDRLSPTQLSQPSFSWIRDQVSRRLEYTNLVEQWQAYSTNEGFQYVDVVVNDNAWAQLGYFRRYGFVLQFGTVAQHNKYQLRVFDSNDVNNREDELAAQDNDNPTFSAASSIRLRGTYFCGSDPQMASLPTPIEDAANQPRDSSSQELLPNSSLDGLPNGVKCSASVAL